MVENKRQVVNNLCKYVINKIHKNDISLENFNIKILTKNNKTIKYKINVIYNGISEEIIITKRLNKRKKIPNKKNQYNEQEVNKIDKNNEIKKYTMKIIEIMQNSNNILIGIFCSKDPINDLLKYSLLNVLDLTKIYINKLLSYYNNIGIT